jgi:hypothetical protein
MLRDLAARGHIAEAGKVATSVEAITFGSLSSAETEFLATRLIACAEGLERENA